MILYSDMSNLAIGAAVTAVGVVAAPVALGATGFGAAGIAAGSLAASVRCPPRARASRKCSIHVDANAWNAPEARG